MMNTIQVESIRWNDKAEQGLKISAGNDLDIIKSEVINGHCRLWRCWDTKGHAGYVVTRDEGDEFCLVLGEGRGFHNFAPHFISYARRNNKVFRTHVKRKGLIKMYAKHGILFDEFVLRG